MSTEMTEMTGMQALAARILPEAKAAGIPRYLGFGNFAIDLKREELFKDGARVKLPGKVYQALIALLEHPGEVVSREALRMRLWPEGTHVNYDANVNTTVNKLRIALGDSPDKPMYVETIPRQGYSFVGMVAAVAGAGRNGGNAHGGYITVQRAETNSNNPLVGEEASNGSRWFVAGLIALVMAGMLFGAAAVMFLHRSL